jgi:hypothetical protein
VHLLVLVDVLAMGLPVLLLLVLLVQFAQEFQQSLQWDWRLSW